jgi:hypothetical protein
MGKIKDMRGQRFGRLTVPKDAEPVMRHGHANWPVICDLHGLQPPVRGSKLRDGSTVSCGCWRADSEVRSRARRGPSEDEHYDDGLEAQRADYEAQRERAMEQDIEDAEHRARVETDAHPKKLIYTDEPFIE